MKVEDLKTQILIQSVGNPQPLCTKPYKTKEMKISTKTPTIST